MILLAMATASAACPDDAMDNAAFRESLASMWDGFDAEEGGPFRKALFEAEKAIACLPEPLTVDDAARFHRNRALGSSLTGDPDGASAAAAAAVRLASEEDVAVWTEANTVFAGLLASAPEEGPVEEFATSLAARVFSDGDPSASRHFGQPVVVQVFSPEGPPVGGAWIDARAPMPDWVTFPPSDCADGAVPVEALVKDVDTAEQAFVALEVEGFEQALQRIASGLPCVDQAVRPAQAAAIHRLEGLRLYTHGARLGAVRSFQEAQILDAAFVPPASVAREGSTLAALWERGGSVGAPPWISVDVPDGVALRVDGIPAAARPATLPAIIQAVSPTGRVLWTRYVPGTVSLPDLGFLATEAEEDEEAGLPPALALYRQDERKQRRSNLGRTLQLGGAALLVGSGLMYGLNARAVGRYRNPATDPDRLPDLRLAANRSAAASGVLLTAGAVGIGVSFVVQ